jgi:hypothetical protein
MLSVCVEGSTTQTVRVPLPCFSAKDYLVDLLANRTAAFLKRYVI